MLIESTSKSICRQAATTPLTCTKQAHLHITKRNTVQSPPSLPEAPNTTIHGHDPGTENGHGHDPGTKNVTRSRDEVAAGAKRHESGTPRSLQSHPRNKMSCMSRAKRGRRDFQQRMERSGEDAKKRSPPGDAATQGHTHGKSGITARVRTNGDHGHAAGTGRGRHGLGQVPELNTGTVAKAVVKAGSEKRGWRKCAERPGAGL